RNLLNDLHSLTRRLLEVRLVLNKNTVFKCQAKNDDDELNDEASEVGREIGPPSEHASYSRLDILCRLDSCGFFNAPLNRLQNLLARKRRIHCLLFGEFLRLKPLDDGLPKRRLRNDATRKIGEAS